MAQTARACCRLQGWKEWSPGHVLPNTSLSHHILLSHSHVHSYLYHKGCFSNMMVVMSICNKVHKSLKYLQLPFGGEGSNPRTPKGAAQAFFRSPITVGLISKAPVGTPESTQGIVPPEGDCSFLPLSLCKAILESSAICCLQQDRIPQSPF